MKKTSLQPVLLAFAFAALGFVIRGVAPVVSLSAQAKPSSSASASPSPSAIKFDYVHPIGVMAGVHFTGIGVIDLRNGNLSVCTEHSCEFEYRMPLESLPNR